MDDKKLMQITLGVPAPWFVKSIELSTSEERIDAYFDFIKGGVFACPICNKPCKIHDTKDRRWRHLLYPIMTLISTLELQGRKSVS